MRRIALFFCLLTIVIVHGRTAEIVRKIPVAQGLASHPVNGGHCLISDGTYQYIGFYDPAHQMTVGKRKLGETEWDFVKLPERVGWDTHNKIVIFLDRAGKLHLTGNMHGSPLRYYRTEEPGDIHTLKGIHTWSGKHENRVTYPNLLKLRDGSIHMMYRLGGSGNGMRLLVHYDEESEEWTGSGESFISGREAEPTCNAYPFGGIQEDQNGVLHITWCWRETPDVETNFDICYAQSTDGGFTWQKLDGTKYELPITPSNAEVVDEIDQKHGLMNGGSLAIDKEGNPYIGYTRFDENGYNQMFVATPVDHEWKIGRVSDWKERFWFEGRGTIPHYPPIPRLGVQGDEIHVSYSFDLVEPKRGKTVFTREALLNQQPDEFEFIPAEETGPVVPNIRAKNRGPLPEGETHYMQQRVDKPNRDRKPDNPMEPTMIYIVVVKQ